MVLLCGEGWLDSGAARGEVGIHTQTWREVRSERMDAICMVAGGSNWRCGGIDPSWGEVNK